MVALSLPSSTVTLFSVRVAASPFSTISATVVVTVTPSACRSSSLALSPVSVMLAMLLVMLAES
ncbi:hypothetical protein FCV83_24480 [Enterovibrio norvegicus]|nr:hypothetical protein FCV83_24480 [Enterovibrio norvegicus]